MNFLGEPVGCSSFKNYSDCQSKAKHIVFSTNHTNSAGAIGMDSARLIAETFSGDELNKGGFHHYAQLRGHSWHSIMELTNETGERAGRNAVGRIDGRRLRAAASRPSAQPRTNVAFLGGQPERATTLRGA